MFKSKFGFLGFRSLRDRPLSMSAKFSLRVMFLLSVVVKYVCESVDGKCCFSGNFAEVLYGRTHSRLDYGFSLKFIYSLY